MIKRINMSMRLLTCISITAAVVMLIIIFYSVFTQQVKNEVRTISMVMENSIEQIAGDACSYLDTLNLKSECRVTLIDADGTAIYDSLADTSFMENHLERKEVQEAIAIGYGEEVRLSETIGTQAYYFATVLEDGKILRLSKEISSIYMVIIDVIYFVPLVVLIVFLLCDSFAKGLAKNIVKPLRDIDLDKENNVVYEEMSFFMRTIERQKKQIKGQMLVLERRFETIRLIIDSMKEGIILIDNSKTILSLNSSALQLFDKSGRNYEGKSLLELTRSLIIIDGIRAALDGVRSESIMEIDGKTLQVFFSPATQKEELSGGIILFFDITEKALAEKMRQEFTANVSHELRTPLTIVLGLSELMVNRMVKKEDVSDFAFKIKNEVQRLINLIEDIIKLSRLDEGKGELSQEYFDICQLSNDIVDSLKLPITEKDLSVTMSTESFYIDADRTLIRELLFNLIDNGIKYNKQGGKLHLAFYFESGETVIKVKDTGIGIAEEHFLRIFERFYRVDKSRTKKTGGTGLGLSIVKHIALRYGGSVEVESKEGEGTTITARLKI